MEEKDKEASIKCCGQGNITEGLVFGRNLID